MDRRSVYWSICLAILVVCSTGRLFPAEPLDRLAIVDRAIEFHGGELYEQSRIQLELCSRSGCQDLDVQMDAGLYSYTVTGPYRNRERRVRVTNDHVEHWLDGALLSVDVGEQQALRDWVMARVYFCFLPYRLNDPGVHKQDLGVETWNGRSLHRVKVTFEPGSSSDAQDQFMYWFDPQTGRLEQFAYSYERGDPGLRFRRNFNFRRIGDILFFDQENLGIEGENLSVDLLTPAYVAEALRAVSIVELRDLRVDKLRSQVSSGGPLSKNTS